MNLPESPPNWGNDELTKFIDKTRANAYATFANLKSEFERLARIDAAFRKIIDNLHNPREPLSSFLVIRAHASFLSAVHLLLGGQIPEVYASLRLTIENALYGFYLSTNAAAREIWLYRHRGNDGKRKVREEFKVRKMLDALKSIDSTEASAAEGLYERSIDFGAHPNEYGLLQGLKTNRQEGKIEIRIAYLHRGNSDAAHIAFRTTAQVGVCTLGIFRLVYKERFDLLGLTDTLRHLRKGL